MEKIVTCTKCRRTLTVSGAYGGMAEVRREFICPFCGESNEVMWAVGITLSTIPKRQTPRFLRGARASAVVTWDNQPWAQLYRDAVLLASEPGAVSNRIQKAITAIDARIQEVSVSEDGQAELRALIDALVILRLRKKGVA